MKKHNETKSKKILVQKNGKVIRKAISFAMIFVMLFCISALASEEIFTQNITVKTETGGTKTIQVEYAYGQEDTKSENITYKVILTNEILKPKLVNKGILAGTVVISYEMQIVEIDEPYKQYVIGEKIEYEKEIYNAFQDLTEEDIPEGQSLYYIEYIDNIYDDTEKREEITLQEAKEIAKSIYESKDTLKDQTNYTEYVTIETPPPIYEGFIGNARGLFDMIFESMQSIFNWLVSPNVIVFFGLGIILSLTTIGILIARRFFWGR